MKTPVLFLIFNRPQLTFRVFDEIRKAKPDKLFIAADGPRYGKEGELNKCLESRRITELVDWPCEVKTLFRDENLGCRMAVSSAIDWFFDNVEEGIILEDDCLPGTDFFYFCQELLEKYRMNERIMHIGGNNFQNGIKRGRASYYFSIYPHIWGWATWRRAWQHNDVEMKSFYDFKRLNKIKLIYSGEKEQQYWLRKFSETAEGKINSWDYPWIFCIQSQNGISIIPNSNLVSNIGIGTDPTHENRAEFADIKLVGIDSISHPENIIINRKADKYSFDYFYNPTDLNFLQRLKKNIYPYLPEWVRNTYKSIFNTR